MEGVAGWAEEEDIDEWKRIRPRGGKEGWLGTNPAREGIERQGERPEKGSKKEKVGMSGENKEQKKRPEQERGKENTKRQNKKKMKPTASNKELIKEAEG